MQKIINLLLAVLLVFAALVYLCCFEVGQGFIAVGAGERIYNAGLQVKWPWQKVQVLHINHQIVSLESAGQSWTIVAEIAQPKEYLKNSAGESVAALVKQAWDINAANLAAAPLLLKNGITIDTVLLTNVQVSDASWATINQKMPVLFAQIAQNILTAGEAQAQSIRAAAEASFLATQKQGLDLAAQVISASQVDAVKMLAPIYQKNPVLFKAYMQNKAQLLKNSNS
jgi:regulator of protease activity HflC (stomatin/prohibitin superfamily)